ncbi:hypothetical protein Ae201684_015153 [Aphanomyces euteiches]|uniref:CCHC-type domain-containing protein n=1 Tax=Aphanomyces euteiches TaxID=100861 RepID=A0A6G0WHK7_9STRA|nr:hypothetical protein Ae201684_015153 [Aphanomyces euteiches]
MSAMDATTAADSYKVNKFNGDNFHLWKFKMVMVHEDKDLWDIVSGVEKWEDQADDASQASFKKRQKKAFAIVCLSLEDAQLSMVRSCTTATQAWKRLEDHYEKKSLANKLYLRKKFFACAMAEGTDMMHHLNDLKTLSEQLEAVGAPVSEEDLVITLLCSLPESYDVLITALESRSDALTWGFVTSRLLHEETKRKEQGNDGMKSAAFLTRQEKMKRFPCKICGQMGHWANKCDRRGEKKQSVAAMAKEESDYLFMASGDEKSASSGNDWFIDSGATHHMTNSMANFKNYSPMKAIKVHLADDDVIEAVGQGEVVMKLMTPQGPQLGVLKNVWFVPKISRNLFSVSQFATDGAKISFEKNNCIMEKQGRSFNIGSRFGKGLYKLSMQPVKEGSAMANLIEVKSTQSKLWHDRLGHIGCQGLETLVKNDMVSDLALKTVEDWTFCDSCALGKHARFKFAKKSSNRSTTLFEEISSDVCGPMQTPSRGGNLYFVTFICGNSTYCWVYLMRHKSEVFAKFTEFHAMVKNQFKTCIKRLRSENGKEYQNKHF